MLEAIDNLSQEPWPVGSVALTGSPGWRRIRIGSYRVVYEVDDHILVVLVLRVGSRGGIYQHLDE